jgi:RNA polymerase sigma-70 factor (ECF subfamily)
VSFNNAATLFWFQNRLFLKFKVLGGRSGIPKCDQEEIRMNDHAAAQLGKKLREIFEDMAPMSRRIVDLLEALAAKDKPPASDKMKNALIAMIPNLRAFAFSLCGQHERADDLVQETLLKAWSHLDSFQAGTNLRAWLFTILRNTFFSEMRKRRRESEDADGKGVDSLSVAPAQQGHVDMQDLHKALDLLPPHQREALILVGAAGMSYEEVAEIAKCAVGTVKSRVNRARSRLAELLGVDGAEAFGPDFATGAITGRIVSAR